MAIYVIRHGETASNAARIVQTPETPLSDRGIAQAKLLGLRFAAIPLAGVLASDLPRAAMTARELAAATGAPLTFEPLLQERNFGELRGRAYADLEEDLFAPNLAPPGGEDWGTFDARVERAWDRIRAMAAATPGDLAVVTHGLVCHSLVANHLRLAALAPPAGVPLRFENTSVTEVDGSPPWTVRRLNCTLHLGPAFPSARTGTPV